MKITQIAPTLPVGTIKWIQGMCELKWDANYQTVLLIADWAVQMQWKPYNLKTDLKSLLLK